MAPPIMTQAPDTVGKAVFPVSLIFYIEDQRLRESIRPNEIRFDDDSNVRGHDEVFRFSVESATTEEELNFALRRICLRENSTCFLVVSDRLTGAEIDGRVRPGPLAASIRDQYRSSRHLCGLLAIDSRPTSRVSDIDRVVPPSADHPTLRSAIVAAATGLRLKALPPVRASRAAANGVKIQAVQSRPEMLQCLALRKEVYGLLGYLPNDVTVDLSGVELDGYDGRSIHFSAIRGSEVVGTVRVVLELPPNLAGAKDELDPPPGLSQMRRTGEAGGISFRALKTLYDHAQWCRQIARGAGLAIRRRFDSVCFMPLPILESTEFDRRWADVLKETSPGAELSRLVVKPEFRGLGISRDLVRAVLAKSIEMKRRVVLLECIPTHEEMYKKYGFRRMAGDPHSRPTDLDQYAIAMWIKFHDQSALADNAEKLLGKLSLGLNPRFGPIDTPLPEA
jgi:GNAT superfamily N-acetyltransferase